MPAFPVAFLKGSNPHGADAECGTRGMSLRAWLAGQALTGLAELGADAKYQAGVAIKITDALLAELAKEKT